MELHIKTRYVLVGDDLQVKENAIITIDVESGMITSIEKSWSSRGIIEIPSSIAIPTLVNSHLHILDAAFPELGEGLPPEELVALPYGLKYRMLRRLNERIIRENVKAIFKSLMNQGCAIFCTYVEEGKYNLKILKDVAREFHGIHAILLAQGNWKNLCEEKVIQILNELLEEADGIGLDTVFDFHQTLMAKVNQIVKGIGRHVHVHVSETPSLNYRRDVEYVVTYLKPQAIIHGTYLRESDISLLRDVGCSWIICPRSNALLVHNIPSIKLIIKVIDNGVNVCLGTDNVAWNDVNLWREMNFLYVMSRLLSKDNDPADVARKILFMATIAPRRLFDLKNHLKGIDEGMEANLIVIAGSFVNYSHNIYVSLVKRVCSEHVRFMFVNKYVYVKGREYVLEEAIRNNIFDMYSRW